MKVPKILQGAYYGKYEKQVHFGVSLFLFFLFALFSPWFIATMASFCLGLAKEWFDFSIRTKKFDFSDMAANVAGILSGIIILFIWKTIRTL